MKFHSSIVFLTLFILPLSSIIMAAGFPIIPQPQQFQILSDSSKASSKIYTSLLNNYDSLLGEEGYHLLIRNDSIQITANSPHGLFYGQVSLQFIRKTNTGLIPNCNIIDYPSFAYRAMHLDVCRHFFPVKSIKKYIDQLAQYKINYLHLHLTDDQGWRIEIKKYPKLTDVGAWRTEPDGSRYGGFYSQEDIKEMVNYANQHFICIIPEIEMPGHSSAALAAYPWLSSTGQCITVPCKWGIKKDLYAPTDTVFHFFENVLDEVCTLFPGPYMHIGGDEAPKRQWKHSSVAQSVIRQNKLRNEEGLQHYFMQRIEQYLQSKGRLAIGWGEVMKGGISDSLVVMSWLGYKQGKQALLHGNRCIMAPRSFCYFDYPQSFREPLKAIWMLYLPLRKVYRFSPLPKGIDAQKQKLLLGGEATLWTEYIPTEERLAHQLLPRLTALAEALWTEHRRKDFRDFLKRKTALTIQDKFD